MNETAGSLVQPRRRRLRLGMVGGGQGAFIGAVHRAAARLDDHYELVAGALSSDPERARSSGEDFRLDPARSYASYHDMAKAEAARGDGIDVVAIVTPNHLHYPVARVFLEAGIHVICDKPMTASLQDARDLAEIVRDTGCVFALTHTNIGVPMVRQARAMVAAGLLGSIRIVQVEYPQDWLTQPIDADGQKQAAWRTDPAQTGIGACISDIGTHAYNLAGFVTGLRVSELCAELSSFVEGRRLDDNVHILMRYENGARGMLWASQVAPGNENAIRIRVYGDKAGLHWFGEQPDHLHFTPFGEAPRLITKGSPAMLEPAARIAHMPGGHPEGIIEAFANLYNDAAGLIHARLEGLDADPLARDLPGVDQGLAGMEFIHAAVASSNDNGAWVPLDGF